MSIEQISSEGSEEETSLDSMSVVRKGVTQSLNKFVSYGPPYRTVGPRLYLGPPFAERSLNNIICKCVVYGYFTKCDFNWHCRVSFFLILPRNNNVYVQLLGRGMSETDNLALVNNII